MRALMPPHLYIKLQKKNKKHKLLYIRTNLKNNRDPYYINICNARLILYIFFSREREDEQKIVTKQYNRIQWRVNKL
jgi:hypothetical protein